MESSQPEIGPRVKIGKIARRLRFTGAVQGVGFRAALCAQARARGLGGWVRNRSDGSVEAEVAGSPEDVAALLRWAQRGPATARVDEVRVEAIEVDDVRADGFAQRPTL